MMRPEQAIGVAIGCIIGMFSAMAFILTHFDRWLAFWGPHWAERKMRRALRRFKGKRAKERRSAARRRAWLDVLPPEVQEGYSLLPTPDEVRRDQLDSTLGDQFNDTLGNLSDQAYAEWQRYQQEGIEAKVAARTEDESGSEQDISRRHSDG